MKNTLKKLIALMLVFTFVFAFAACKKDDGKETTTGESTTLGEETTADSTEETTQPVVDDSTEETSEDVSEDASETGTVGTTGAETTAAAGIKFPIGGSQAQIIEFYNTYGNALKQYKGKVTVSKKDGTVSRVNYIKFAAITKKVAEDMLPNDYSDRGTLTFNNGVSGDRKLSSWLPRSYSDKLSEINPNGPNGVKSATCTASGSGCKIVITFDDDKTSGLTALSDKPKYVSKAMDTLSLKESDLGDFKLKGAVVNYTGCKIEAVFDAEGRITKLDILTPAQIMGDLAYKNLDLLKDTDVTGEYKGNYAFVY
ncbi:MAG TPA: hypothetical protein PKW24_07145 [Clostridiales bacterium]|nr:hypothetical protein [Clostridiales bacterium]HRT81947.1 hypothetical protein [Oscillospiraceae bacterium]